MGGAGAPPPLDSESVNKTTQSSPSFFVAEGLQDIEGEVALRVAALDVVRSDKNVQLVLSSNDIDAVMLALACTELPLDTIVVRSNRMPAQTTTLNQAKEEFDILIQKIIEDLLALVDVDIDENEYMYENMSRKLIYVLYTLTATDTTKKFFREVP